MPLTSAEKQARYRARNVVLLTGDAHTIADKLMEMEDPAKLIEIVFPPEMPDRSYGWPLSVGQG
jgi:hypothetical protein